MIYNRKYLKCKAVTVEGKEFWIKQINNSFILGTKIQIFIYHYGFIVTQKIFFLFSYSRSFYLRINSYIIPIWGSNHESNELN